MSLLFTLSTILEVAVGAFIIWGLFNEEKLAEFEQKVVSKIKSRFLKPQTKVLTIKRQSGRHCA